MPIRSRLAVVLCALTICAPTLFTFAQPTSRPSVIIGVWYQPASSFAKWKTRGINTLVGYESEGGTVSRDVWTKAARDAGLFYMLQPTDDPVMSQEAKDPYLLSWILADEPDAAGNLSPDDIAALAARLRQLGNVPLFINFDGWQMRYTGANAYKAYAASADVLASDYYPLNHGDGPAPIPTIGKRVDDLKSYGKGKPVLSFIECSDQQLGQQWWVTPEIAAQMRGPTPKEMQLEIDTAMSHAASGIIYFPDVIGAGWISFDGVTPDLEVAMINANAALVAKATGQPIPPPVVLMSGTGSASASTASAGNGSVGGATAGATSGNAKPGGSGAAGAAAIGAAGMSAAAPGPDDTRRKTTPSRAGVGQAGAGGGLPPAPNGNMPGNASNPVGSVRLNLPQTLESSVIGYLRGFLRRSKGQFPFQIEDPTEAEKLVEDPAKPSPDESKMLGTAKSLAGMLGILKAGKDYDYAPRDAKLGDGTKVVFWYRDKASGKYRAIFADLTARDVKPEAVGKGK